jgi:hypothetical protein
MGGGSRWYRGNLMEDAARYLAFREKRGAAPGKCQLTCAKNAHLPRMIKRENQRRYSFCFLSSFVYILMLSGLKSDIQDTFGVIFTYYDYK